MNSNLRSRVLQAITNTRRTALLNWEDTLEQRLSGKAGSRFTVQQSFAELESILCRCDWELYVQASIPAPYFALKTTGIPGRLGLVALSKLKPDGFITLKDVEESGQLSCTAKGIPGEKVDFSVIILGEKNGMEIVYALHPGEPEVPSSIQVVARMHGRIVSVEEARALGLVYAEITT
jgi:hypothetical protein